MSQNVDVRAEIARIHARTAELVAEADHWINVARALAREGSHYYAHEQARQLGHPLSDEVYPVELLGKYNDEFAVLAWRHTQTGPNGTRRLWPTVRELVASFGHWFRYTERAANQLLAAELSKPHDLSSFRLMQVDDDEIVGGLGDYRVAVKPECLATVREAYLHFSFVEDALDTGLARAAAGDADPFGVDEQ